MLLLSRTKLKGKEFTIRFYAGLPRPKSMDNCFRNVALVGKMKCAGHDMINTNIITCTFSCIDVVGDLWSVFCNQNGYAWLDDWLSISWNNFVFAVCNAVGFRSMLILELSISEVS